MMAPKASEVHVWTAHPMTTVFSHKREIEATKSTLEAPEVWMGVGTRRGRHAPALHSITAPGIIPVPVTGEQQDSDED